ncbi:MAG: hypothetical protein KBT12_02260 [Bacteroidales bacterium]|nr:hypothetical protein [Candidatus Physcousia equi]
MRNNRKKINQSVMYGVMALAIVVVLAVLLFWYLCIEPKTGVPAPTE